MLPPRTPQARAVAGYVWCVCIGRWRTPRCQGELLEEVLAGAKALSPRLLHLPHPLHCAAAMASSMVTDYKQIFTSILHIISSKGVFLDFGLSLGTLGVRLNTVAVASRRGLETRLKAWSNTGDFLSRCCETSQSVVIYECWIPILYNIQP